MISFNRNILFPSEIHGDTTVDISLETIHVIEDMEVIERISSMQKSESVQMSGQDIYYYRFSHKRFNDLSFSWAMEIKNALTLFWDAEKKDIYYIKKEAYSFAKLQFWVLHTFLPLVLELQRIYRILHVGSIEIDGKPVLFSAPSFGGKSTMVDYFLKQGHFLMSDDSIGIEKRSDSYYAIPSYPFHRPYRQVETLGIFTEKFAREPKPVHVMYLLNKIEPEGSIEIKELKGIDKFKAFHYSSFIDFAFMKQERFEYFTEMAKNIPVYQISYPHGLGRLEEVYDALAVHSRSLS